MGFLEKNIKIIVDVTSLIILESIIKHTAYFRPNCKK